MSKKALPKPQTSRSVFGLLQRIRNAEEFPSDLVQEAAEYAVYHLYSNGDGAPLCSLLNVIGRHCEKEDSLIQWLLQLGIEIKRIKPVRGGRFLDVYVRDRSNQMHAMRLSKELHFEGGSTANRLNESKIRTVSFDDVIAGLLQEEFPKHFIYLAAQRAVKTAYLQENCSELIKLLGYTYAYDTCHDSLVDWLHHAGIHAEPLMPYGPTEWQVFVRLPSYQAVAFDFIKQTPFNDTVRREINISRAGRTKDDWERDASPGTSVFAISGGGTGVGGRKHK